MTTAQVLALAEEAGFSHAGQLNMEALRFLPEVRDMCSVDRCKNYGRCWTCPPHCGTLEETAEKARQYSRGVLLQSTGQMEDDFDVDCMMETERLQKQRFSRLLDSLRPHFPTMLPMGSGGCSICKVCTCPNEPCRFPEKAYPSMEAYGLFVSDVCKQSDLPYYYGPQTITYTACILLD